MSLIPCLVVSFSPDCAGIRSQFQLSESWPGRPFACNVFYSIDTFKLDEMYAITALHFVFLKDTLLQVI